MCGECVCDVKGMVGGKMMLEGCEELMLGKGSVEGLGDVMGEGWGVLKMGGIVGLRGFLDDVMRVGMMKGWGRLKGEMELGRWLNGVLFEGGGVNEGGLKGMFCDMLVVVEVGGFWELGEVVFLVSGGEVWGMVFGRWGVGIGGVIGGEIVLGCRVNGMIERVGDDDMGMRVLGGVNGGFGIVKGKSGGVGLGGLVR